MVELAVCLPLFSLFALVIDSLPVRLKVSVKSLQFRAIASDVFSV